MLKAAGGVAIEVIAASLGCSKPTVLKWRAINHGVFRSVAALIDGIERFLAAWNDHKKPFVWVKSAEQILAEANRQCSSVTAY